MVADDDLALGRIVEGISKSRFWPNSLILVVEDDAQDGVDHVDGHRTVALAIGPFIRRDAVDSNNYNHTSMIRTIQEIFQIPPRTRFLTSARRHDQHLHGGGGPEAVPSTSRPKSAIDEMNPPLKALSRPPAMGRPPIRRHELARSGRCPAGRAEPHSVVGRQRLRHSLSGREAGAKSGGAVLAGEGPTQRLLRQPQARRS